MSESQSLVQLTDASIYQQDTLVLENVNLNINKGEFVYLIGKTGSGKSSLLKTLYGDLELQKGTGSVVEHDLLTMNWKTLPYLRRKLGIVFQDFHLLTDRDVQDNLSFTLEATGWKDKKEMEARIEEVLALVGLKTKGHKMPHELSGGEQQRIVIARALLNHPELILADEPTGNLDDDTSDDIMELLRKISNENKVSVLMATHDTRLLDKFPSRIIKCESGQLIDSAKSPA